MLFAYLVVDCIILSIPVLYPCAPHPLVELQRSARALRSFVPFVADFGELGRLGPPSSSWVAAHFAIPCDVLHLVLFYHLLCASRTAQSSHSAYSCFTQYATPRTSSSWRSLRYRPSSRSRVLP